MRTLYNAALLPLRAASVVFGAWPRGSPRAELARDQRLARRLPAAPKAALWIHGASVGEARLIGTLAREIRGRRPGLPLMASAVTATGRAQLPSPPAIDAAFFLPLDFVRVQRSAFDLLQPSMLLLVETELWPNLLAEAAKRRIPAVVVNARLAPERFARYRRLSGLYRPLLRTLAVIGAAAQADAERFAALGALDDTIRVIGNLKFDLAPPTATGPALRARFGIAPGRPIVAAGSTGDGEDAPVLEAFAAARREVPDLLLVLAPRHPERFDSANDEAARRGFVVRRVSGGAAGGAMDVLLVDTIGDLAALYALAGSAFVGGSLVRIGGHNLLEPVAAGVPVLFGPHTGHVAEIAAELERAGAGLRVSDAATLGRTWAALAANPGDRARRAARGHEILAANRGAVQRAGDLVLSVIDRLVSDARA